MAEILIKSIDAVHSNPEKDKGCYKRGDIVDVRPDGHPWGREEGLPKFVIVKIPGLDPATVMHLMSMNEDRTDPERPMLLARRLWRVLVDSESLPSSIKNALKNTGQVTVTLAQIRNYVQNKITQGTL